MSRLNRRDFIKSAGLLTGTALLARPILANAPQTEPSTDPMSRVVVVTDDACTTGTTIHPDIVQVLIDEGIKCYTEITNVGEAWKSIFPGITTNSVIGIKVNCINSSVPSNLETAQAIVNGLTQMPVPGGFDPNNIIIWDRTNSELQSGGYTINTGTTGVRCYGTNQSGVGYIYSINLNVNGVTSHPSRIFAEQIDYLINLAVIKDHSSSGATMCLKNHYGSVSNIGSMHGGNCDPYIPSLNQQLGEVLGDKEKFCIIDSIFGVNSGGPGGSIDFIYNGMIMGEDIVSVDRIGLDILVENGMNHAWQATHIETASQPPYNLGNYNSSLIERINIENPSTYTPHSVTIIVAPVGGPIVIPAGGGSFNYTVQIVNNEATTVDFNAWTLVQIPSGSMYGPLLFRALELPAGGSINRTMSQFVPPGAPPGEYQFIARVGEYPAHVWNENLFPFTKE